MGLFSGKPKAAESKEEINDFHEKRYAIPYSKSFRGFKKYHVTIHGYEEAEKNNRYFCSIPLDDLNVEFVCLDMKDRVKPERMAKILINGLNVGAIFSNGDAKKISEIEEGEIIAIHVEKDENEQRLKFFAKYKDVM